MYDRDRAHFHRVALTRLRPILITSIAFIAGLLPLVASGTGSASRHSLRTAVVGGMLVSTVLDLTVLPAMYIILDESGTRTASFGNRISGKSQARPAAAGFKP